MKSPAQKRADLTALHTALMIEARLLGLDASWLREATRRNVHRLQQLISYARRNP